MQRPIYKCIKHYPGGPCSGYILKPQSSHWQNMWYWYMNNWFDPEEFPEYWEPVKEPIFITEDGCDVYDKELLYVVGVDQNCMDDEYYKVSEFKAKTLFWPANERYKWFKSKEKAEEYILENKPQFSKKQLKEISNNLLGNYIRYGQHTVIDFDKWLKDFKK